MKNNTIALLLVLVIISTFLFTFFVINKSGLRFITGDITSQNTGTINLTITRACGDGTCDSIETCSNCAGDCGVCPSAGVAGGGGGGQAGPGVRKNFGVDVTLIKVLLKEGDSMVQDIRVENTGAATINIEVDPGNLFNMMGIPKRRFTLNPGAVERIAVVISAVGFDPGVYTGGLTINGEGIIKKIPVIIEVESKKLFFDLSLDVAPEYRFVMPGDELMVQVTLFNLEEIGKVDVGVDYVLKDLEGNVVSTEKDIVAVEKQASFSKRILIPSDLKEGDYVIGVYAVYKNSVGTSSYMFHVGEPRVEQPLSMNYALIITGFIIVILFSFGVWLYLEHLRLKNIKSVYSKESRRIYSNVRSRKDVKGARDKLLKQLSLLKRSYDSGYITKVSYAKGREEVNLLLKRLK